MGGGKEAEPLRCAGAGRAWLGRARKLSISGQAFFSNRLQQEQTNGFTPASAKGEIRRERGGDKTEKVVVGFRLSHSSGYPCETGTWQAQTLLSWCQVDVPAQGWRSGRSTRKCAPPHHSADAGGGHPCSLLDESVHIQELSPTPWESQGAPARRLGGRQFTQVGHLKK